MIDTNGFLAKYLVVKDDLNTLEKEKNILEKDLEPYYKDLKMLEEKYADKKAKKRELIADILSSRNFSDYYYFRSIVDGIYNLLKNFGWKYSTELFNFLSKTFYIRTAFEAGFEVCYIDEICDLCPTDKFPHVLVDLDTECLNYEVYDPYNIIKIPLGLDIYKLLESAEVFLKESKELDAQKEQDKEYQEYLRLKEKYGDKNVD
jgi:hypothetical protein